MGWMAVVGDLPCQKPRYFWQLRRVELLMKLIFQSYRRHLPYPCHLTQVNTPHLNPRQRPVLDLPTPEGWKDELTYSVADYRRQEIGWGHAYSMFQL